MSAYHDTTSRIESNIKRKRAYRIIRTEEISDARSSENANNIALSRLVDKGNIRRAGKGKFYKTRSTDDSFIRVTRRSERGQKALRRGYVYGDEFRLANNLFWSNRGGKISLDAFLLKVIDDENISNLSMLRREFGDAVLIETYLSHFKAGDRVMFEGMLGV